MSGRTFGGGTSDTVLDPDTRAPLEGAVLQIFTSINGAPITVLTDLDGNQLADGVVRSDADGKIVFKTTTDQYESVFGKDAEGKWWRFDSWESAGSAALIAAQFPAVQAAAEQASADVTGATDTANEALARVDAAIAAGPNGVGKLLGQYGDLSDDVSSAVTAAIADLPDTGGTVIFPTGQALNWRQTVTVEKDDVTIDLNGCTLTVNAGDAFFWLMLPSFRGSGYGAGARNFKLRNGTVQGEFTGPAAGRGIGVQAHHAQDMLWEDVKLSQGQITAHYLELGGVDGATFRRCTFEGANPDQAHRRDEAIQLDYSYLNGLGIDAANPERYDGLPCRRIKVEDCKFLPITVGGVDYPAPNPIGQHVRMQGQWIEDVTFRENYVEGGQRTDDQDVATTAAWLHGFGIRGWKIIDNTFVNTSGHNPTVFLSDGTTGDTGYLLADVAATSLSTHPITPQPAEDVEIRGNHFYGFDGTERTAVIKVAGFDETTPGNGVRVVDNYWHDAHNGTANDSNSAVLISLSYLRGVKVNGNEAATCGQLLYMQYVVGFSVADNPVSDSYDETILLSSGCANGTVNGNAVNTSSGALRINGGKNIAVTGNEFGYGAAANAIRTFVVQIGGSPDGVIFAHNIVDGNGTEAVYGIQVTSGGASVAVKDNTVRGSQTPVSVSANVVESGNLTLAA